MPAFMERLFACEAANPVVVCCFRRRHPALLPANYQRHNPIAGALLTNTEIDHFSGLLTIRESWPLSVLVTQKVAEAIKSAPAFDQVEKLLAGDLAIAQSRRGEAK